MNLKTLLKEFVRQLGLGFSNFNIVDDVNESFKNRVRTLHNKFDLKGNIVSQCEFKLSEQESAGTNKLFDLSGYIVFVLVYGKNFIY